jgi:3-oxoacyl-[acyl-carrier-protein] synthase-3
MNPMKTLRTLISGTGRCIPSVVVPNAHFLHHAFHGPDGVPIDKPNQEILDQFETITGIRERRYVTDDRVT